MAQDPMDNLVDGMERMEMMSFDDLPDIAIMQVMEKLPLRDRLRMRLVSKRMDRLQLQVKNKVEEIAIYVEYVTDVRVNFEPKLSDRHIKFDDLKNGLPRLALNTHVQKIVLCSKSSSKCDFPNLYKFVEELENLEADELEFFADCEINISNILSLAQKFEKVLMPSDMTAQDLCLIRKKMFEGDFKLKSLNLLIDNTLRSKFTEECFGVTIEDAQYLSLLNTVLHTRIYRTKNESVEFYADFADGYDPVYSKLIHIEGDLKTTVDEYSIKFEMCDGGAKYDEDYVKVKMNHLYENYYSDSDDYY